MCTVCGTTLGLATEAPQAQRERAFILARVERCETKEQIRAALAGGVRAGSAGRARLAGLRPGRVDGAGARAPGRRGGGGLARPAVAAAAPGSGRPAGRPSAAAGRPARRLRAPRHRPRALRPVPPPTSPPAPDTPSNPSDARDHALGADAQGDAEVLVAALLGRAHHLAVAVEGREGLGHLERVGGEAVRGQARGGHRHLVGQLQQAPEQQARRGVQGLRALAPDRRPAPPPPAPPPPAGGSTRSARARTARSRPGSPGSARGPARGRGRAWCRGCAAAGSSARRRRRCRRAGRRGSRTRPRAWTWRRGARARSG